MKRYKRKKKPYEITPLVFTPEPSRIDSISGVDLICPICGETGSIIIRAIERSWYRVVELNRGGNYGPYADWGDHLDGETEESWLLCDSCNNEISEEAVFEHTLKAIEEAHDEAI